MGGKPKTCDHTLAVSLSVSMSLFLPYFLSFNTSPYPPPPQACSGPPEHELWHQHFLVLFFGKKEVFSFIYWFLGHFRNLLFVFFNFGGGLVFGDFYLEFLSDLFIFLENFYLTLWFSNFFWHFSRNSWCLNFKFFLSFDKFLRKNYFQIFLKKIFFWNWELLPFTFSEFSEFFFEFQILKFFWFRKILEKQKIFSN